VVLLVDNVPFLLGVVVALLSGLVRLLMSRHGLHALHLLSNTLTALQIFVVVLMVFLTVVAVVVA